MPERKLDWVNTVFLASAHLIALLSPLYWIFVQFSWWTLALALLWSCLCGISVTGGYHRLFAHRTYQASAPLRAFYLFFGAAAIQNSALKWSRDHRVHHRHTDEDKDPYNINRGFWWAHIGWVLFQSPNENERAESMPMNDLLGDPLVRLQHRFYLPIAIFAGFALPALIGSLWGDAMGAFLIAGFLRLVLLWQATFSINSVAHILGSQKYSLDNSARDSFITALISMGEGYHNFHHRFQSDYRNGVRWYQFDPTKWWVWTLSHVRLTRNLKRASPGAIASAKQSVVKALAERRAAAAADALRTKGAATAR